jgi:hypothetical protein
MRGVLDEEVVTKHGSRSCRPPLATLPMLYLGNSTDVYFVLVRTL